MSRYILAEKLAVEVAKMDGDSTTNNIYNCETCKNLCCDGCEMYEGAKNGG